MLDVKIVNGKIVDIENRRITEGDIGINEGKIAEIGSVSSEAKEVIDAKGNYISPGFVDIHMHEEDFSLTKKQEYDISETMLNMGVTTCVVGNCGNNRQSIDELAGFINEKGNPVNYMSYIGHNYLRNIAGNEDIYKKSTKEQISKMQALAYEAINNGAVGISYGLEYCPGIDTDEAIEITKEIQGRKDLLLAAHYRKDSKFALDAIREMATIGKETEIPFQISHLSSCSAFGNMTEALNLIDDLVKSGIDLSVDAYPYAAFSTFIGSAVFDEGCFELWNKSYDSIMLTEDPFKGVFCDKELFEKARKEYPKMLAVAYVMNEEEIVEALNHPLVMVASDGIYRNHSGHPRGAGTFPRVIGHYVRDKKLMDFYDAIYKMTYMPAKRLNLRKKGLLKEGYDADIVIFNYDTIIDKATFQEPQLKPEGIDHVILNGRLAVKQGNKINNTLGRYYKRGEA
ncbi:amidohydrolase family protein [Sedimentibacter hydroxybenzoicus DSM 7310]|uniref:Amidohydrolase family protein n=1 Tax=Sedimentibacter hydroxybenzoicus DSM 7310 TaxID=1123245 RepID=A0A974BIP2_SEDHY|nr:amidohydrolase family protein [Sedimentibacter hydroxybenzoicus]NYB73949.1 amidohydrolase family protein [Sedimentibacter hydroxybenzoicus DSM 7310]